MPHSRVTLRYIKEPWEAGRGKRRSVSEAADLTSAEGAKENKADSGAAIYVNSTSVRSVQGAGE